MNAPAPANAVRTSPAPTLSPLVTETTFANRTSARNRATTLRALAERLEQAARDGDAARLVGALESVIEQGQLAFAELVALSRQET